MKSISKKILSILLVLAFLSTNLLQKEALFAFAESAAFNFSKTMEDVLNAAMEDTNTNTLQELIDSFADKPLSGNERFVLSIRNSYNDLDYSLYRNALEEYAKSNQTMADSTALGMALTLKAVNGDLDLITSIAKDKTGKSGIISWTYGLFLFSNEVDTGFTSEEIIQNILDLRYKDGGWAIMGDSSDVDITCMVLQSLAPFYNKNLNRQAFLINAISNEMQEKVNMAVEEALCLLSKRQFEDGAFMSFGTKNPESAIMVWLSLASLGIDITNNKDFEKNENTVFDYIEQYKVSDGRYAHVLGSVSNKTTCGELLMACCAQKMLKGDSRPFYLFSPLSEKLIERTEVAKTQSLNIKIFIYIGIGVFFATCSVFLILKKRGKNSWILLIAITVIAAILASVLNINTEESYYRSEKETGTTLTSTISINCQGIAGETDKVPSNGYILDFANIELKEGASCYDQLVAACKKYKIQLDTMADGYVCGINYIYEFDFGNLSGWMFRINGEFASESSQNKKIQNGDFVEWIYTKNLGKDVGDTYIEKF